MPSLQAAIAELAADFAVSVLAALRSASLDELLAAPRGAPTQPSRPGPGRPRSTPVATRPAPATPEAPTRAAPPSNEGRLARRSAADIANALAQVVALVKQHPQGLRAEHIRAELNMDRKELPRVLKEGLAKKSLLSTGEKRATTYTAG